MIMNKFKPGDKVKCIDDEFGKPGYVEGEIYIVKSYNKDKNRIYTVKDSEGSEENGWHSKYFELIIEEVQKEYKKSEGWGF